MPNTIDNVYGRVVCFNTSTIQTVDSVPLPVPFNRNLTDNCTAHVPGSTDIVVTDDFNLIELGCKLNFAAQAAAAGTRILEFQKNGATLVPPFIVTLVPVSLVVTSFNIVTYRIPCVKGDIFTLVATQNSGGNLNIAGNATVWADFSKF